MSGESCAAGMVGRVGKYTCRNTTTHTLNDLEGEEGKLQPKKRSWKAVRPFLCLALVIISCLQSFH